MKFEDAIEQCKDDEYITRLATVGEKYYKNHFIPLTHQVIWWEQKENDWEVGII